VDEHTISPAGDPFHAAPPDDDTVEAHYAGLERPHVCMGGLVFVGYTDEYGEEREASYPCRRCCSEAAGETS
jgi:hypothetical protein